MIALETEVSVESLEKESLKLGTSAADQLRIPTSLRLRTLGNQAALTQFIVTWARRQQEPRLLAYPNQLSISTESVPNLFETIHGLAAGLLAGRIEGDSPAGVRPEQLVANAYRRFLSIDIKGQHLSLVVSDRHPLRPRTASFLQLAPDDFAERAAHKETFISDLRVYLNRCFTTAGATPFSTEDARRILEVIYELFANTEEWASSDLLGNPFPKTVRGLLAEIIPIRIISEQLAANKRVWLPLARYLRRLIDDTEIAATHLLEVSIFDSGIGLARRDLKRPIDETVSTHDEYTSVLNCLRKHGTSSGSPLRGRGLFNVMRLMTRLKGFVRLRTGRLGLFRDFFDDPFPLDEDWAPDELQKEFYRGFEYLWDWDSNPELVRRDPAASTAKTKRVLVEGALFTLWVPLRVHGVQLSLL